MVLLEALRPRQWTKNLLVLAGLFFTLGKGHLPVIWGKAFLGVLIFCLLSGATYLINDLKDREADRAHPKKSKRPLASGRLSVPSALAFVGVMVPAMLALAFFFINFRFGIVATGYFLLTLSYSFGLKHLVLVDVLVLALGFVLRALAGAWAVGVPPSPWLLVCTFLLALCLGLTKRRSELVALGEGTPTRPILSQYSLSLLDQLITIIAAACLMAYVLYTFFAVTSRPYALPPMMATIPFMFYGLMRYLYVAQSEAMGAMGEAKSVMGETPEMILTRDKPFLFNFLLWGVVALAAQFLSK
jgi:4-hydroxybenzoate polyprenyltransferase